MGNPYEPQYEADDAEHGVSSNYKDPISLGEAIKPVLKQAILATYARGRLSTRQTQSLIDFMKLNES